MRDRMVAALANAMTIGQLAREVAVNVETIRFYERIGLIEQPEKPVFGHRRYAGKVIGRVQFIQRAKTLGFSLKEIRELLAMEGACCDEVRVRAEEKRRRISEQIRDLKAIHGALGSMIDGCNETREAGSCSFIDALAAGKDERAATETRNYIT